MACNPWRPRKGQVPTGTFDAWPRPLAHATHGARPARLTPAGVSVRKGVKPVPAATSGLLALTPAAVDAALPAELKKAASTCHPARRA